MASANTNQGMAAAVVVPFTELMHDPYVFFLGRNHFVEQAAIQREAFFLAGDHMLDFRFERFMEKDDITERIFTGQAVYFCFFFLMHENESEKRSLVFESDTMPSLITSFSPINLLLIIYPNYANIS